MGSLISKQSLASYTPLNKNKKPKSSNAAQQYWNKLENGIELERYLPVFLSLKKWNKN